MPPAPSQPRGGHSKQQGASQLSHPRHGKQARRARAGLTWASHLASVDIWLLDSGKASLGSTPRGGGNSCR